MSDDYKTKAQILDLIQQAAAKNQLPKRLHIPRVFEAQMCLLSDAEVGAELARQIMIHGVRKAIKDQGNTLFGAEIVWDAKNLELESD